MSSSGNNVLLKNFLTPFACPPFEQIQEDNFLPAIEEQMTLARQRWEQIKQLPDPSFAQVIEALEFSAQELDRTAEIFYNLLSANSNSTMQELAKEISAKLATFSNDLWLDGALFCQVQQVYASNQQAPLLLSGEQKMLLTKTYRNFVRNGALLNEGQKEQLRSIDQQLAQLSLAFGDNVLAATQKFFLHLTSARDLEQLPPDLVTLAQQVAKEKGLEGYVITLDAPSYLPFLTYSPHRALREQLFLLMAKKCTGDSPHSNDSHILQIVQLRHQRAQLLGYASHGAYVLEERMATDVSTVNNFLNDILHKARPAALKQYQELSDYAREHAGIAQLMPWDLFYIVEKVRQAKFSLDQQQLRPFFPLEQVVAGVFQVANQLYGINFELDSTIPKYHGEVVTYQVREANGSLIGILYLDFFPRPGKRSGAWMTSFRNHHRFAGAAFCPQISIVCNFTRPLATQPSLLTFEEVTTLFHEFGHALHGLLSECTYPSLSGTNVYWDFVELPSQILENWCFEPQCLDLFARHYQSGEKIPDELIAKIKASANFNEGYNTLRQLSLALIDMGWHGERSLSPIDSIEEFEKELTKEARLLPVVPGTNISTSFSHIFQGGYSAGYYSYKWAEVLEADAFELFAEKGIFSPQVGSDFRKFILAKGGSVHPLELYQQFRGKLPDVEPLLKRAGLLDS